MSHPETRSGQTGKRPVSLASLDYSVLQQCMHCGMCLPTCPTYDATKIERHSPRGRISLMRAVADGDTELNAKLAEEMYYCLGCLACETACPAGVDYTTMFETARAEAERTGAAGGGQRLFWRWLSVKTLFMRPRLLRLFGMGLRFYQVTGLRSLIRKSGLIKLLPKRLADLEPQMPTIAPKFSHQLIEETEKPTKGEARYRVALLTGCVQDLSFPHINRDTAEVLKANGCEIFTPKVQPCCGSLHAHNGETDLAKKLARDLIDLIPPSDFDAIISNAGGCGSHLRHYGQLLEDDPKYGRLAKEWDQKLKDIHEWLAEIGIEAPTATADIGESTVTYHHSCHLCHGQKVRQQPIDLLTQIPGISLATLPEADWCCGSAGIYNITQPEQSESLLKRKTKNIQKTGAEVVATANPGCHLQIARGLSDIQTEPKVYHPVSLLAQAYRNQTD